MKKIYDLVVTVGSYEKNGETKKNYKNVGSLMQSDNGKFIILDRTFNPAGLPNPDNKSSCLVSLYKPKDNNQNQQNQSDAQFNGDIPF